MAVVPRILAPERVTVEVVVHYQNGSLSWMVNEWLMLTILLLQGTTELEMQQLHGLGYRSLGGTGWSSWPEGEFL